MRTLAPSVTTSSVQSASPNTGQTINVVSVNNNILVVITPAASILSLTINMPSDASTFIGQSISMFCSQAVTTLTIQGAANIYNNVTSFLGGDLVMFMKVAANTWCQLKPL